MAPKNKKGASAANGHPAASNGNGKPKEIESSEETSVDDLAASGISRPSPDAILADEADPDTLLGLESDSEAGGSRPVSMLASTKRASKRVSSRQLLDVPMDNVKLNDEETPKQTTFSAIDLGPSNEDSEPSPDIVARDGTELRNQVTELTTQVTSLNNKLVNSFMRIGDLEDDVSQMQEAVTNYRQQVATLEKERGEHLAALNTGLLVEKEHVSTEMQKMMERLVEETAEKGRAVSDKQKIEAELDELSSSLFSEANKMVANERLARARAEEKSKSMEERLRDTEEIVGEQAKRLVELQALVEQHGAETESRGETSIADGESNSLAARSVPGKGSTASAPDGAMLVMAHGSELRLDIVPYVELRAFLNHLRRLRLQLAPFYTFPVLLDDGSLNSTVTSRTGSPAPQQSGLAAHSGALSPSLFGASNSSTSNPFTAASVARHRDFPSLPANVEQLIHLPSQLSSLSFLKRINDEDCEPCLRLDYAPGLNWLSRRQLQTAILEGSLMIEPIFGGGIYDEEKVRSRAVGTPPAACAMCGKAVVNVPLPGGGNASDASSWMNAATSLQASVNAMTSSLPGREATASPPPGSATSTASSKDSSKGKTSIFSTLRNISGGSSRSLSTGQPTASIDSHSGTPTSTQTNAQQVSGVVEDQFAPPRQPVIPTHIFRISESSASRYLLCPNYCLRRLRAACDFWSYIRSLERAVVLEGKFAWDDEPAHTSAKISDMSKEDQSVVSPVPRLPTKDSDMSKGQLHDADQGTDDDDASVVEGTKEEANKEVTSGKKESKDDSASRSRKVSLTHTASDADENDFADAMSQHTDESRDEADREEKDEEKEDEEDEGEEDEEAEEKEETKKLAPPAQIEPGTKSDGTVNSEQDERENEEKSEDSAVQSTPIARPPPLPQTARPLPERPLVGTPPALPPRRVLSPSTPPIRQVPPTPSAPAVDLGPEPKRLLPLAGGPERMVWEEKVWLEVNRLRADMWSARVGVEQANDD